MPDLDDATGQVVIAGASAGGMGVERQLDRVVETLMEHNVNQDPPFYAGFIDSAFPPELEPLGFQHTWPCTDDDRCDSKGYVEETQGYYLHVTDTSCLLMHLFEQYKCTDMTHLVRHHIMTPFFLEMSQKDELLSSKYQDEWKLATAPPSGQTVPAPMTVGEFALRVREAAASIPSWSTDAEERPNKLPGAFVPLCTSHAPLHNSTSFFETKIGTRTWEQVWDNWLFTATPRVLVGDPTQAIFSTCK